MTLAVFLGRRRQAVNRVFKKKQKRRRIRADIKEERSSWATEFPEGAMATAASYNRLLRHGKREKGRERERE